MASVSELIEIVKPWTALADRLVYSHLPRFASVWQGGKLEKHQAHALAMLSTACCSASFGQLLLLDCGKLGEAEILGRTVLEGTLKFVYLISEEKEITGRFSEFSTMLFEFAIVKDHFSVRSFFDTANPSQDEVTAPLRPMLLPDSELADFKERFSKADRSAIEQRWSVPNLIARLSRRQRPGSEMYAGLMRNYIMCSHIAHADYYGLIAMREREGRPEQSKKLLDLAQAARIVSDVISLSTLRITEALQFAEQGDDVIRPILEEAHNSMQILNKVNKEWFKSEFGDRC